MDAAGRCAAAHCAAPNSVRPLPARSRPAGAPAPPSAPASIASAARAAGACSPGSSAIAAATPCRGAAPSRRRLRVRAVSERAARSPWRCRWRITRRARSKSAGTRHAWMSPGAAAAALCRSASPAHGLAMGAGGLASRRPMRRAAPRGARLGQADAQADGSRPAARPVADGQQRAARHDAPQPGRRRRRQLRDPLAALPGQRREVSRAKHRRQVLRGRRQHHLRARAANAVGLRLSRQAASTTCVRALEALSAGLGRGCSRERGGSSCARHVAPCMHEAGP